MTTCKIWLKFTTLCLVMLLSVCSQSAFCQNAFEKDLKQQIDEFLAPRPDVAPVQENPNSGSELFPSDAPASLMTPTGFGGYGTYIFGGVGGAYPEVYRNNKADLIASAGFCVGNPESAVNFAASVNMTDVHRFSDFSGNFILSRKLFTGTSMSAGALQMFASRHHSDAPGSTFYMAISHAVQTIPSLTPGCSRLSYTIGLGSGRFYEKSPYDIAHGKGKHGTAIFGGISFEVIRHVSLNAEWTGMNLGFSAGIRPFKSPISLGIGVANLTKYSSNGANMVFSVGLPLSLTRLMN
jgi:hypothetical protein